MSSISYGSFSMEQIHLCATLSCLDIANKHTLNESTYCMGVLFYLLTFSISWFFYHIISIHQEDTLPLKTNMALYQFM